ncbi:unnamed protein product [Didymodactylos carnosus]|uniref:RNA ligase domain-containing protein n=1 Tax=Didymodactylos carnosus TaxID=1234261 RepID=A0A814TUN2_9BILA|nr:unnamed protein product [Didymodactylos carnosus]CAF1166089.1 unnamed protein product [Didymodactylos carnosus]CAF3709205.1 unnamed protein product [Didymodactylos carnosus]CAF3929721.1 unnamed protein product [Didymodactylos carnosus]
MIAYPETEQFRNVISKVVRKVRGKEEEKRNNPLPLLKFIGTVKLHGTNSAIGFNKELGHWFQSRNNVITSIKDNAGFAKYFEPFSNEFIQEKLLNTNTIIREEYEKGNSIIVFGEWCGGNIQSNVAITGLPKMFVIFKIKIVYPQLSPSQELDEDQKQEKDKEEEEEEESETNSLSYWLQPQEWSKINWHEKLIYNIYDFPVYEIDIDFNEPKMIQNKLIELTDAVEKQCPVGLFFNRPGLGEGIVWTEWATTHGTLTFKVKGQEHAVTKVKTLAAVDTEKLNSVQEFIDYACTDNRMKQGLDYLREQQIDSKEMKNVPVFLKWLTNDIIKEEKDTMDKAQLDPKDVTKAITTKGRTWYMNNI